MTKLTDMTRRRKEAHAKLLASKSKVYEAFLAMEHAAYSDGVLPKKHKELITGAPAPSRPASPWK